MKNIIDSLIPERKVLADARTFLRRCHWTLEVGGRIVNIPPETAICVQTRAYVLASAPDIFLDNHVEATVLIGCERDGNTWTATYAAIKLYYDEHGNFISEDRFPAKVS